ncbi:MAG: hypothetical protein K2P63_15910 [Lachnospiraceae bacterium]|nr:hypothetical protein [Lachnospiraceae bacterium]
MEATIMQQPKIYASIMTKFAENQKEAENRDCAQKAFCRLIKRLREVFPCCRYASAGQSVCVRPILCRMQGQWLPVSATFFFVADRLEAGMKKPLLPDTDRPQDLSDHGGIKEAVEQSEACRLLEAWKQEAVCNWYEARKTFKCMA